jgi:hypothetical protein
MGMPEPDIDVCVERARQGGPVIVGFGTDDEGVIPPLQLCCPGGSEFELTEVRS